MKTLAFNRVHKNGWVSFKLAGVPGAVYVDKRMFVEGQVPGEGSTIELEVPGLQEPGASATEAQAAKAAARLEKETKKAERAAAAAAKAQARLEKLQAAAGAAKAVVDSANQPAV